MSATMAAGPLPSAAGSLIHVPVLYDEVLDGLAVRPGGRYIDGTVGAGGHAAGVLERSSPDGVLLGMDADGEAIIRASQRLATWGDRAILCQRNFRDIGEVAQEHGFRQGSVDGILLDLGLSSPQLASPRRGFSFAADGPLDMRFDTTHAGQTAADIVNTASVEELSTLFLDYGEERAARRIAGRVVWERARAPIQTTTQLGQIVRRAKAGAGRRTGIDPATLVFQALRIAVNDELTALQTVLPRAVELLRPGGRLAVIAFHSLEDRIVKDYFRQEARSCLCPPSHLVCTCAHQASLRVVTQGPRNRAALQAGPAEVAINRRARSARLRVVERL